MEPEWTPREVLLMVLTHLAGVDGANAAIHCAPVRYSPLTFRVAEAVRALSVDDEVDHDPRLQAVWEMVWKDRGAYAEDRGR